MRRDSIALPGQLAKSSPHVAEDVEVTSLRSVENFERPDFFSVKLQKSKTNLVKSSPMFRCVQCERNDRFAKWTAFGKT